MAAMNARNVSWIYPVYLRVVLLRFFLDVLQVLEVLVVLVARDFEDLALLPAHLESERVGPRHHHRIGDRDFVVNRIRIVPA